MRAIAVRFQLHNTRAHRNELSDAAAQCANVLP